MKKIAFIIDPLENLDKEAETTFFLMKEVIRQKAECLAIELKDLFLEGHRLFANAKHISVTKKQKKFSYKILKTKTLALSTLDAIFLRKDPPVDTTFFDHLSLLETTAPKTFFINHPSGIKRVNEKLFTLEFPDLVPPTLVSQSKNTLVKFIRKYRQVILKPLNLSGGQEIIKVTNRDPSLLSLLEIQTKQEGRFVMAQKFIPEAKKGDKRILMLDGEILGVFLRRPSKKDFRGNLHRGAKFTKTVVTKRDKKIIKTVLPKLKALGLFFVGLDIIGPYLTEINVTSPMGIREINALFSSQCEKKVINWLQKRLSCSRPKPDHAITY